MKSDTDDPVKTISDRRIQTVCLMVLAGVAGVYLVYWLRPILVPFIVACFIVSGVGPILTYLEHRFNVSRVVAAGMTFLFGVAIMGIFGFTISVSIIDLAKNKEQYRSRVRQLVDTVEDRISFDFGSFKLSSVRERIDGIGDSGKNGEADDSLKADAAENAELIPDTGNLTVAPIDDDPISDAVNPVDKSELSQEDIDEVGSAEAVSEVRADNTGLDSKPKVPTVAGSGTDRFGPSEHDRLQEATELVDAFVRDGISVVSQAFVSLVSTSIVVLIYVFFLLLGKPTYAQTGTMREIDTQIRGYLSLKTVISIATGAVFGITLRLFGVPMALSFGVLAFLLNFIPNIGPIVASLLPVPLILLDPSGNIVWMVAVIAATSTIQLISGNVVEPKLMGNSSDLHPVTILLGLMFWGMMWGIIGMFLATPITAAMKIVLERFAPTRQIANIMAGRWETADADQPDLTDWFGSKE